MNLVRDDVATMLCGFCGEEFTRRGRKRHCDEGCRKAAWRRRHAAPVQPMPAKPSTVYECAGCGERYLGEQRCDNCNTWCRKVGAGGPCPHCDELVAVSDIIHPDQFNAPLSSPRGTRTT